MNQPPAFDVLVSIGPQHLPVAPLTLRALDSFVDANRIWVLADAPVLTVLKTELSDREQFVFLDESALAQTISRADVEKYLEMRVGSDRRAGWYFQQFLKMGACCLPEMAPYYLIWDADTIPLQPMKFFDAQGRVLVQPGPKLHMPYFATIERLLGRAAMGEYSFVSEHLMVERATMERLLEAIDQRFPQTVRWTEAILASIDEEALPFSGFSEFETYGDFALERDSSAFARRSLRVLREGTLIYGRKPGWLDLLDMMLCDLHFVSFEVWHNPSRRKVHLRRVRSLLRALATLWRPSLWRRGKLARRIAHGEAAS